MKHQLPQGWHSRGYLPHFDGGEITQFLTFRLHDSVPQRVIQQWKFEIERNDLDPQSRIITLNRKLESYADRGYGQCWLRIDSVASMVENALLYYDNERYRLLAWVIMPNHIHMLITPLAGHSLSDIMKSIKTWTSRRANEILQRKGRFWMPDYYDRFIRNSKHYFDVKAYIENNPVKAGLSSSPPEWRYSSAWHHQQAG